MTKKTFFSIIALITASSFLYAQNTLQQLVKTDEKEAERMAALSAAVSPEDAIMTSSSKVNWTKKTFSSDVRLDMNKAGFPMPSGKSSGVNRIKMELPVLIKDPLLSLYVDDLQSLNDLVLEGSLTLEQLTGIIENAKSTPAYFAKNGNFLMTSHTIQLQDLGSLLVKHRRPYQLKTPIEHIASRSYSGIIIDARGKLPVFGEFTESSVSPGLFPKIWNEEMDLLYEKNMVDPQIAVKQGIVYYSSEEDFSFYKNRIGNDPLWINAKQVYGVNRIDPVISKDDYLRIACIEANRKLLEQGKVVILLNKEELEHAVGAPEKNKKYYLTIQQIKREIINRVPDNVVIPDDTVLRLEMNNLKFIADSAELLPSERPRVQNIAQSLKKYVSSDKYTILVEGHTADVNKPNGQMILSIERAQSIINALVEEGLDRALFTYKGYGGTQPLADNSTEEGRAQNRRVVITLLPKTTYVQRR